MKLLKFHVRIFKPLFSPNGLSIYVQNLICQTKIPYVNMYIMFVGYEQKCKTSLLSRIYWRLILRCKFLAKIHGEVKQLAIYTLPGITCLLLKYLERKKARIQYNTVQYKLNREKSLER